MLLVLVGLLVGIFSFLRIWRLGKWYWAWLGKGETTQTAIDRKLVSDEVVQTRSALDAWYSLEDSVRLRTPHPSRLSMSHLKEVFAAERVVRDEYLDQLRIGWYQVVLLFVVGSVAGLVLEDIWMRIAWGVSQSRAGLVWGPFSPMYGVGVVLMTVLTFRLRKYRVKPWIIFLLAAALGGALEQFTGWAMESFMGAVCWDYSHLPTALSKWVAWPFLIIWGLVGLVWYWFIMPELLYRIGEPTTRSRAIIVALLTVFLSVDVAMTLACFNRRAERDAGIPPVNSFDVWVDEHFSDEFMSDRFENMMFDGQEMGITPRVSWV